MKVYIIGIGIVGVSMNKKCSNCGHINVENARFCLKCGNTLENYNTGNLEDYNVGQTNYNVANNNSNQENQSLSNSSHSSSSTNLNEIPCLHCGISIPARAQKCRHCGQWVKKRTYPGYEESQPHSLAIVVGYIFIILGGLIVLFIALIGLFMALIGLFMSLIGLFIAIYLATRDNKEAKAHGQLQLGLFFVMFFIWLRSWR